MKPAYWKRVAAYLIDNALLLLMLSGAGLIFIWTEDLPTVIYFIVDLLYSIFMEYRYQATVGKMMLRLKVICPDVYQCTYRNIGKLLSAFPMYQGFLRILAPHCHQTYHDELSGCVVVLQGTPGIINIHHFSAK